MTAHALIADLRARGVTLVADGARLRCRPKAALTGEDLAALRANKAAVLSCLRSQDRAPAPGLICYSCKGTRFWLSIHGAAACATCHPPAAPNLVAEWIDIGDSGRGGDGG